MHTLHVLRVTLRKFIMIKSAATLFFFSFIFISCNEKTNLPEGEIPTGIWRAVISQQGKKLPFNFEIKKEEKNYSLIIHNGEERIIVDEVVKKDDSLLITMPFFDSGFKLRYSEGKLTGNFQKYYTDDYILPFEATYNIKKRFKRNCSEPEIDITGKWEVQFKEKDGDTYPAIGKFTQNGYNVTGTFLTQTGDYRYLEGNIVKDKLQLSCFDGNHLFLFEGNVVGDKIVNGNFWHGKDTHEKWSGEKNSEAKLASAYDLTYIKEGYDKLAFSFPDLDSNLVSLDNPKFKDKVVLVQVFGTWCPNCVDETKFLSKWYKEHQNLDVEIVGLAYESKADFQYAKSRVEKLKSRIGVDYQFLIAGVFDKKEAANSLPMLNHIISFPTLIFINKKGEVHKIHTGFTGPGTGENYTEFVREFDEIMAELTGEPA